MQESGNWDVSFAPAFATTFSLKAKNGAAQSWVFFKDDSSLNDEAHLGQLNVLNARDSWSADVLLSRLQADVPLKGDVQLGFNGVQGVMTPATDTQGFDLTAAPQEHRASVVWPGTAASTISKGLCGCAPSSAILSSFYAGMSSLSKVYAYTSPKVR